MQAEDTFKVNAKAAFAVDAQSGKILYDQDGEKTMGIASITKIIGLYIVLDQVKEGKLSWDDKVSISDYAENLSITPDLSNVPLHKENTYTVKELFDSAIIQSANASMVALAEKISGSEAKFTERMKEQLKYWMYQVLRPKCLAKTRNHQWKWSTGTGCSQDSLITRKAWTD